MVTIINLTKHDVDIRLQDENDTGEMLKITSSGIIARLESTESQGKILKIEPSGIVARLESTERESDFPIDISQNEDGVEKWIDVTYVSVGVVVDLPDSTDNTIFIVSFAVAQAVKGRWDVYYPYPPMFDENYKVIGAHGLGQVLE